MNFDNWCLIDNIGFITNNINIQNNNFIQSFSFNRNESLLSIADNIGKINIYKVNNNLNNKNSFFDYFSSYFKIENFNNMIKYENNYNNQINQIIWLRDQQKSSFLFTVNSLNIKLWKISHNKLKSKSLNKYKTLYNIVNPNLYFNYNSFFDNSSEIFQNNLLEINKILNFSLNINEEMFITNSYKDISITLIERQKSLKLFTLNENNQNIFLKKSICNSQNDQIYAFGKNNSEIGIIDNRISLFKNNRLTIINDSNKNIYCLNNDYMYILTDIKYSNDSRFIITRDLNSITVWDTLYFKEPLFQNYLTPKINNNLCNNINNKNQIEIIQNNYIVTGLNNNLFIFDIITKDVKIYNISKKGKTIFTNDLNSKILLSNNLEYDYGTELINYNKNKNIILFGNSFNLNILSKF